MGNETKDSGPASEEPVPSRTHFHIVLGLILIPFVSAALGWILAVSDVFHAYATKTQRTWTRLLVALVLIDSLVVMGWITQMANKDEFQKLMEAQAAPKSRIGIVFEPEERDAPPVITRVLPDLPAEKAGVRAGDLILEFDGAPLKNQGEVRVSLARSEPGVPRKIKVRREGAEQVVEVVPAPMPKVELFEVLKERDEQGWAAKFQALLPAAIVGLLAWAVGWWWFKDRGKVWLAVLIVLAGAEAASFAALRVLNSSLGGMSVGAFLIALGVQTATLLGLGLLARRLLPDPRVEAPAEPRRPVLRAYLRGGFYMLAGVIRIGFLLLMIDYLWFGAKGVTNPIQQVVERTRLGSPGTVLLILDAVLLAPIGEELLFRGFLLPRLLVQGGKVWAVGISALVFALLHPQYGLYIPIVLVYGVVLGWARLRTGGLATPILLHMTLNAMVTASLLFQG